MSHYETQAMTGAQARAFVRAQDKALGLDCELHDTGAPNEFYAVVFDLEDQSEVQQCRDIENRICSK